MTYEQIMNQRYEELKSSIDEQMEHGKVPSIKMMRKFVKDIKQKLKAIEFGANFATSIEEIEKANKAIARLNGEMAVYQYYINVFDESMKSYV